MLLINDILMSKSYILSTAMYKLCLFIDQYVCTILIVSDKGLLLPTWFQNLICFTPTVTN